MSNTKVYYEHLPIFERNIMYGNDIVALKKEVLKYFDPADVDCEEIFDFKGVNIPYGFVAPISLRSQADKIVMFVMFVRDDADIGTVSHEATHVCSQIFEYVGQLADEWNDEVQAYLIGHVTKTFMERIRGIKRCDRILKKGDKKGNLKK